MAGRGFFGRIVDRVRQIVAPPPPPREREPPPEQPREVSHREYRHIWRDERPKGNFNRNLAVFERMMNDVDMPQDERPELWESFIRNIVKGQGVKRRNSTANMFWRDSGIDPADMDWAAWRAAMGYTGRRRSRTP